MFGNLIDGSQNALWPFAHEGEIPQHYDNRRNTDTNQNLITLTLMFRVKRANFVLSSMNWTPRFPSILPVAIEIHDEAIPQVGGKV